MTLRGVARRLARGIERLVAFRGINRLATESEEALRVFA